MKKLVALLALLWAGCTYAGPPSCYPGEADADAKVAHIVWDLNGCAAVWFCDSHSQSWLRTYISGTLTECAAFVAAGGYSSFDNMTHSEKDALWKSTFTGTATPEQTTVYRALADNVPWPTVAPPSGVVTRDTTVYKMRLAINTYSFVAVGKVPLLKACVPSQVVFGSVSGTTNQLTLFALANRNDATMDSSVDVKPLVLYAKCL